MNRFMKKNKLWLSLLGIGLLIIAANFIFKPQIFGYQLDKTASLKQMNDPSFQVSIHDIAGKQLIDIRQANMFEQGHAEKAINIPVSKLLDKESLILFDQLLKNGSDVVLYGIDELQATAPWFLLQQLGYKNVKILKGGIGLLREFSEPAPGSTEISVIDTALLRVHSALGKPAEKAVQVRKPETIIPVRKGSSSSGGC